MEITKDACDVFWENPRKGLDDVKDVHAVIRVDGKEVRGFGGVMCKQARARLLSGFDRLLKPPAKREKDSPDA